jgi:ABC-2 type transport system ATP-binding protein
MMEVEARIEVSGVHKRFGSAVALDGMTFTVPPGQVTGFVGPNGAGKPVTESWLSLVSAAGSMISGLGLGAA